MKPQATKATKNQIYWRDYWKKQGYHIRRGERVPERYDTPPSFDTRHPVMSFALFVVVIVVGGIGLYVALHIN